MLKKLHLNTFPAVHLKKLDWWDLSLKFSSEALVIALCLMVGVFNLYFLNISNQYTDKSQAAKFLSYHSSLNNKLYTKNTTSKTVIAQNGFITQALADEFVGLSGNISVNNSENNENNLDNGLVQINPDSAKSLIAQQVKVYKTKQGDSLQSIAKNNGISVQTIIWANDLKSNYIAPGWDLIILPTDGVYYQATSNDTIPDIAKKFKSNTETIVAYNALGGPEDIEPGQFFIIPDGIITPKPTPKPKVNNSAKVGGNAVVQSLPDENFDSNGHIFPKGYCTWYVAQQLHGLVKWGGNAKNWLVNAKAYGAVISNIPAPRTIVVTNENRRYGHVALVEKVDEDSILVSEMNYEKFGKMNYRRIPLNSSAIKGYIYP